MTGRALAATRQRQGGQPTPGCLDAVQQIFTTHETMVRSPGSVYVSSVVDVKHDDFVLVLVDSVQDTVGAASRRMDAGEVPAKSPTNAVQVLHQGSRNKLDDRRCYGLGEPGLDSADGGGWGKEPVGRELRSRAQVANGIDSAKDVTGGIGGIGLADVGHGL